MSPGQQVLSTIDVFNPGINSERTAQHEAIRDLKYNVI